MGDGLMGWMWWECSHSFRWLIEHGVHEYEWQPPGAFQSKDMVVDDTIDAVGSYNVANGSCFHRTESSEIGWAASSPGVVRRQFELDLQNCRELTLDRVEAPLHREFTLRTIRRNEWRRAPASVR